MKSNIIPAVKLTLICIIFFSGIYTSFIYGVSQFSSNSGKGEVIMLHGKTFYAGIGQHFTDDRYFHSRPSAVNYRADGSGGSNKGPSNPAYLAEVQARIDTFLTHNPGIDRSAIPSDLVTASGSGLDPHISVQAAIVQVPRIAKIRGMAEPNIEQLIISNTEKPLFGLFGPGHINVLKLNIALDNLN